MADTAEYIRTLEDELRDAMLMMEHPDAEQRVRASLAVEALTTAIDCMERDTVCRWLEAQHVSVVWRDGAWRPDWQAAWDSQVARALSELRNPDGWPTADAARLAAARALGYTAPDIPPEEMVIDLTALLQDVERELRACERLGAPESVVSRLHRRQRTLLAAVSYSREMARRM